MDPAWLAPSRILAAIEGLSPTWLYLVLLAASFLENLVPVMPGDLMVVLGGYLAARGGLHLGSTYLAVTAGSWAGFLLLYAAGRGLGRSRLHARLQARFPRGGLARVEGWFARWGLWVILANRFLAGTRAVISLFAGLAGLPWAPVALLSLASCAVWNGLLVGSGWWVGAEWERLVRLLTLYNWAVLAVAGVLLAGWLLWRRFGRRR